MNKICNKIKALNIPKEKKLTITKLYGRIRRAKNEKTIIIDGHRYFFTNSRYCGCC